MKYYAASGDEREIKAACFQPPYRILTSYHYFKNKQEQLKGYIKKHWDVFIDSGAFSAESSGKEIDIDEYIKFIKEIGAITYAGLDVIGDAKKTMENMKYMEAQGLKPIPTFHMGSDLEDLKEVASGQYPYIALGGLVFSKNIINHCDATWEWILKNNPKLRVHGFGLTNVELMKRYPWYSVDSSSYKGCRRFGRQSVIWNNFEFETFEENEYIEILRSLGHKVTDPEKQTKGISDTEKARIVQDNKDRWFLYDYYSVQSYKIYAAYLGELNKTRKFEFLTQKQTLF